MAKKISIIEKDVVRAIEWAAAEYKFLQELKKELAEVDTEASLSLKEKELHKALRILKYVGRAERRAYRYEQRVYEDLKELYKEFAEDPALLKIMETKTKGQFIEQQQMVANHLTTDHLGERFSIFKELLQKLREFDVGRATLANWASLYGGQLKGELKKEELLVYLEEHLLDKTKAAEVDAQCRKLLQQVSQQVGTAEEWLKGLEATLGKAKALLGRLDHESQNVIVNDGYALLEEYGFPVAAHRSYADFLAQHPTDLEWMASKAGSEIGAPFLFQKLLIKVEKAVIGKVVPWEDVVKYLPLIAQKEDSRYPLWSTILDDYFLLKEGSISLKSLAHYAEKTWNEELKWFYDKTFYLVRTGKITFEEWGEGGQWLLSEGKYRLLGIIKRDYEVGKIQENNITKHAIRVLLSRVEDGTLLWNDLIDGLVAMRRNLNYSLSDEFFSECAPFLDYFLSKEWFSWKAFAGYLPLIYKAVEYEIRYTDKLFNLQWLNEKTWPYFVELVQAKGQDTGHVLNYVFKYFNAAEIPWGGKRVPFLNEHTLPDIIGLLKHYSVDEVDDILRFLKEPLEEGRLSWNEAVKGIVPILTQKISGFTRYLKRFITPYRWPYIIELNEYVKELNDYVKSDFLTGPLRDFLDQDASWPWLAKIARESKEDGFVVLRALKNMGLIRSPQDLEESYPFIIKIVKMQGEKEARDIFWKVLEYLKKLGEIKTMTDFHKAERVLPWLTKVVRAGKETGPKILSSLMGTNVLITSLSDFEQACSVAAKLARRLQTEEVVVLTDLLPRLVQERLIIIIHDLEEIEKLPIHRLKISTYGQLVVFLKAIGVFPQRMNQALKNLIAELMIRSISLERADIEQNIPQIKQAFIALLQLPGLDLETKFLLRRLSALLPLGGNEQLIYTIRNEAIALQEGSGNFLEPLRQKVHNFPGREDIDIIAAYLHFLSTDDTTSLEALCKLHRIRLDLREVNQRRSSLLATQKTAESLLAHLNVLWHFISADFSQQTAALEQQYADMKESHELKAVFGDVLKKTKKLEGLLSKGNNEKAAHLIGDLRFDVHFIQERTSGDLKNELYFFDLFLQAVDTNIHADVVGKISLNTWEDVLNITQLIIQKTFSIIAVYQSDVALAGAVKYLEDFRKNKSFVDLRESLEYFHYGIDYVLKKVITDFKKIFKEKMAVSKKELEELVSPFYRTGPIFQLGQLVGILDTAQRSGQIKIIIKQEPRSVTTHLRERLYERLGLY